MSLFLEPLLDLKLKEVNISILTSPSFPSPSFLPSPWVFLGVFPWAGMCWDVPRAGFQQGQGLTGIVCVGGQGWELWGPPAVPGTIWAGGIPWIVVVPSQTPHPGAGVGEGSPISCFFFHLGWEHRGELANSISLSSLTSSETAQALISSLLLRFAVQPFLFLL